MYIFTNICQQSTVLYITESRKIHMCYIFTSLFFLASSLCFFFLTQAPPSAFSLSFLALSVMPLPAEPSVPQYSSKKYKFFFRVHDNALSFSCRKKEKNNYFLAILYTPMLLLISQCRLLFVYAHTKKYNSSAKKITEFMFSSFHESNILCKDNRYLLKERR